MKLALGHLLKEFIWSPPTRGAWIETAGVRRYIPLRMESPPTRGAWIETATPAAP